MSLLFPFPFYSEQQILLFHHHSSHHVLEQKDFAKLKADGQEGKMHFFCFGFSSGRASGGGGSGGPGG
jgi:hypothetical protein